jgi:hypothetical protein
VGGGEEVGDGGGRGNVVQILYIYICMYVNGKMIPVETVPGMGKGDKREWRKV